MNAWACIAAKNEEATIGDLVRALVLRGLQVVVTDDGSTDRTAFVAAAAGAYLQRHEQSRGIGPALMLAWRYAILAGAERIVQLDAGGSHDPRQAWDLLNNPAGVVLGSRFVPAGTYEGRPWRARLSRLAAAMCNAQTGAELADWTSGYRAFSRPVLEHLLCLREAGRIRCTMHAWQIETLGYALTAGATVAEVPISYTAGESSFRLATAWEALNAWRQL